jgi:hypothetical protein
MHWIHMDPYMAQQQGLMNTGMNLLGPQKVGNLYTSHVTGIFCAP